MICRTSLAPPVPQAAWSLPSTQRHAASPITTSAVACHAAAIVRKLRRRAGRALAAGVLASGLAAQSAHAIPVGYTGVLASGGSATDTAQPDSGPFGTPELWDFWTVSAPLGARVTISVRRLAADLDPVLGVWFGQEADTGNYFDMFSDSLSTTWFGAGDDELAANVAGGPGGDAFLSFTAIAGGTYVIGVADHTFTPTTTGNLPYLITAAVPEPSTALLLLGGLAAAFAPRKRKSRSPARS